MARGLKKHLKRLNAPKHWMLDKLGGAFAPRPSSGPHKSRECLPLILILRNRLKSGQIRLILLVSWMLSLFQRPMRISVFCMTPRDDSVYTLLGMRRPSLNYAKSVPFSLARKFNVGNVVMVTGGRNRGRVGVIKNREKHKGSFENIHVQDGTGHEFATRLGNVFNLGKGTKPWVSLPKGKGIKLSIIEEARKRLAAQSATA
ncbi:hypothetical protein BUALT_Bualt16G0044100 [Buddleja alternifolia]|uniref:KOW domain-containing protein n=1 Tax=Buddleja alternifolia TaxID=168488 RepID=A0AAV6WAU9_9LAMI|nr:hypothetical protein BUALT_Bualt16G0044100 [Buddleja alternifolia]